MWGLGEQNGGIVDHATSNRTYARAAREASLTSTPRLINEQEDAPDRQTQNWQVHSSQSQLRMHAGWAWAAKYLFFRVFFGKKVAQDFVFSGATKSNYPPENQQTRLFQRGPDSFLSKPIHSADSGKSLAGALTGSKGPFWTSPRKILRPISKGGKTKGTSFDSLSVRLPIENSFILAKPWRRSLHDECSRKRN